jgi:hypothetical protein
LLAPTMNYFSMPLSVDFPHHTLSNTIYREFSATDLRNVGNYALGRLVGKGSFGKVYLATHKLTNNSKVCNVCLE